MEDVKSPKLFNLLSGFDYKKYTSETEQNKELDLGYTNYDGVDFTKRTTFYALNKENDDSLFIDNINNAEDFNGLHA